MTTLRFSKLAKLVLLTFSILVTGCVSTSMEYRSATTAARSEKNLKKAEEWGLKALTVVGDEQNAWVPYFLAIEVYKPQKKWEKMAEMLEIAYNRNPEQKLERPFALDGQPVITIKQGVEAYREQEWGSLYNSAVEKFQSQEFEKSMEILNLAIMMNPGRGETYGTLAALYLQQENTNAAKETANNGIKFSPDFSLNYQVLADIATKEGDFDVAEEYYHTAISKSEDPGPIMRQLILLFIDKGENQKAIDYSEELLNKYPDDADLYFNIGVLFQRLAIELFDPARELYLALPDAPSADEVSDVYTKFKNSRKYAYNARDYFLSASDLEIEGDGSSGRAAKEMKKLMKQIDEIFIPSIREIARSQKIDLN